MENINGGLGFVATLDINDFNVSADAMERHIRQVSTTTQIEAEAMEQSMLDFAQKGAMYIQAYLVGQGMTGLLNSIVQVRGQFQQLEIAFGTMLGNEQKAKALMDQMIDTAAHTPFDLMGVASGAKQLLAYGEAADKVNDTLVRLGNIASGLSIPLNDIVYLYGTTMVQGRLYANDVRQFTGRGIPLVKELAKMYGVTAEEINNMVSAGKIGFPDVEKVINSLTDAGGQFYNLMEKQSASLTGMISNLEDAWDGMLNDIGTSNQDVFAGAISSATYLVENYQKILDILEAIVISYGSYKAAIVLNTLATKGYTGVALIDNTVRQAKIGLMKAEAVATGQVAAQTKAMQAAQEAHIATLEKELTAEELATIQKNLRIATIQSLLTAQQQEYISNLGLTTSSEGYEAAAMSVLSVEQRMAVSKLDLSANSAIYRSALEQEVLAKRANTTATLDAMRADVSAAARRVESTKAAAVAAMQRTEAARYEVYWAKQTGDATAIATAEKKLEAAQDNQAITRKAALAAQTDFHTKKKILETTATRQSTVASQTDTAAKTVQTTATNFLSVATTKATMALRALWATMLANPIGWLVTIIGTVISAITLFGNEEEEAADVMGDFQKTTKEEIDQLHLLFAILQSTDKETKTHKDAIEKVNAVCKEYNKTLLDENATIDEQKLKYHELTKAIQETTAEKIKGKYVEQAVQDYIKASDEAFEKFTNRLEHAQYDTGKRRTFDDSQGGTVTVPVMADAESIQNMQKEVQDAIRSIVEENAKIIAGTNGDTTELFNKTVQQILAATKEATGATDAEIKGLKYHVETYLTDQIAKAKEMDDTINRVDTSLSKFFAPKDATPVVESTNYVEMSFEDLDKKIKENQDEIDKLNAKIIDPKTNPSQLDALKAKLQELLGLQAQLNGAVTTKTNNLNTDEGIQARIKALREENATLEYGNKKRAENAKQILQLQEKMDRNNLTKKTGRGGTRSGSGSGSAVNSAEQLAQKQLEAQRKLEEARIQVMEEGYAKRKAALDLQHQEALDRINKEEKELENAYKRAGKKGGLSANERAAFQERRNLEKQSYDTESTKLFDGEIEYKKRQYQAYFNWVKNVGQEVADSHFKTLIAEGSSFTSWVNKQIADLEAKQAAGTFTDGDANALNALKLQKDEIAGNKTAMDQFKESLQRAVGQAQTLAEKLQAVQDLKDRLSRGDFHLNEDDAAAAAYSLENQETELNQQVSDEVLNNYRTFEEKKLSITQEYTLLRNEAMKQGDAERLAQINQAEAEALSALNAQMLMQTDSWKDLFSDLDSLTVTEIEKLIADIRKRMSTADLKLNPADLKAVMDKLDEAKKKVLDTNPFKALGTALTNVFKKQQDGSKKTSKQIKTDWKDLSNATQGCFDFVNDAISSCSVLGDLIGDNGKATMDMIMGVTQAGIAMAAAIKTAEKASVILAAISMALSAIQWIATLFNNDDELQEEIEGYQRQIDSLGSAFNRLQNVMSHTYWEFTDEEEQAYRMRVKAVEDQIATLEKERDAAAHSWNLGKVAEYSKQIKELQYTLEKVKNTGDSLDLFEVQKENLRRQQDLIRQQIEAEKDKKDTDWGQIEKWEENIKDIDQQIEDLHRQEIELLAGTDVKSAIDEFADALVDAYCQGEDAAVALGEKTKEVLKKAVVESLKRQFLAKGINDAVDYLGESLRDGSLSDTERQHFTTMVNQAGNLFNQALEGIGDWIKDVEENTDPLTGAVMSMSEDTGGIIAGRLNAFIINQADQTAQLRAILIYQAQISKNTANTVSELKGIKTELQAIRNSGSSLLSQGIA